MKLILSLNLIFGFMFVIRNFNKSSSDPLINNQLLPKIGTAIICCQIFVAFFAINHPILVILAIHALSFLYFMLIKNVRSRQFAQLNAEFSLFIQDLVMNLRLGIGFSRSADLARQSRSPIFAQSIHHLIYSQSIYIGQSRQHLFLLPQWIEQLKLAEQNPHNSLKRLVSLREELQNLSDFRRRSGQATAQAQIQVIVLWILFVALSFVSAFQFGWSESSKYIGVSALMFVLGQLVFKSITRKHKWNV